MVHTALRTLETSSKEQTVSEEVKSMNIPTTRLSFASFKALFDFEPTLWREYYSPQKWDSIEARIAFVTPDLKTLPNVIHISSQNNMKLALKKQAEDIGSGLHFPPALPSTEELAFRAALIIEEAPGMDQMPSFSKVMTHAQLLFFLYSRLVVDETRDSSIRPATKATAVLSELSGKYIESFTQKVFWVQQILTASVRRNSGLAKMNHLRVSEAETTSTRTSTTSLAPDQGSATDPEKVSVHSSDTLVAPSLPAVAFDDFIRSNLHLVYEDLPFVYYSPEIWHSNEAKEAYVPPNRRNMASVVSLKDEIEKDGDDDWEII
jgi:hypothetical protein